MLPERDGAAGTVWGKQDVEASAATRVRYSTSIMNEHREQLRSVDASVEHKKGDGDDARHPAHDLQTRSFVKRHAEAPAQLHHQLQASGWT